MQFTPKFKQSKNMPLWLKIAALVIVVAVIGSGIRAIAHSKVFDALIAKVGGKANQALVSNVAPSGAQEQEIGANDSAAAQAIISDDGKPVYPLAKQAIATTKVQPDAQAAIVVNNAPNDTGTPIIASGKSGGSSRKNKTPTPDTTPEATPEPEEPQEPEDSEPVLPPSYPVVNLIVNPSLEIADGSGNPINWNSGAWGSNDAVFTYPVDGVHEEKAAKVTITNHESGDGKWFFDDIAISGGIEYLFSHAYASTAETVLLARYTYGDGSMQFEQIAIVPSTNGEWAYDSREIQTDPNAVSMTVFHVLATVGELTTDYFSLSAKYPNSDSFAKGIVSLTFDDGWLSHYTNALSLLDDAGLKATFYITSDFSESIPNLVQDSWYQGNWGENDAVFEDPKKITITNYTDGDAKWYFQDVPTNPNQLYRFTEKYASTAETTLTARYTYTDESVEYGDLITLPSTNGAWKPLDIVFYSPTNIASITMFHRLAAVGELTIADVVVKERSFFVSAEEVLALHESGHEIGSHTRTHPFLTTLDPATAQDEIETSKSMLESIIGEAVTTIAYPYGDTNAAIKAMVQNAGYVLGRGVQAGFNSQVADKFNLKVQSVNVDTPLAIIKSWIDAANSANVWLILMFHQVDHEGGTYSTTPEILADIVQYLNETGTIVKTVRDTASLLE